jgi:hypothetical protein
MVESLTGANHRRATWICIFLAIANQLAGVNTLNIYAGNIFSNIVDNTTEPTDLTPGTMGTYMASFGILGAFLGNLTVKFMTRRALFMVCHIGCSICLILISVFIEKKNPELTLVFVCILQVIFQAGNGSGFWQYVGEVANAAATGMCVFVLMALLFLQSLVTPYIVTTENPAGATALFYFFAGFQVLIIIIFAMFLKESKGLSK